MILCMVCTALLHTLDQPIPSPSRDPCTSKSDSGEKCVCSAKHKKHRKMPYSNVEPVWLIAKKRRGRLVKNVAELKWSPPPPFPRKVLKHDRTCIANSTREGRRARMKSRAYPEHGVPCAWQSGEAKAPGKKGGGMFRRSAPPRFCCSNPGALSGGRASSPSRRTDPEQNPPRMEPHTGSDRHTGFAPRPPFPVWSQGMATGMGVGIEEGLGAHGRCTGDATRPAGLRILVRVQGVSLPESRLARRSLGYGAFFPLRVGLSPTPPSGPPKVCVLPFGVQANDSLLFSVQSYRTVARGQLWVRGVVGACCAISNPRW